MTDATSTAASTRDADLVTRVARGEERALGLLYDRYGGVLYAVAYRIVGQRVDAEEVVMEAFSQAWRDAPRFDPARGSVAAWLTMMARSRALDLVRARSRRTRITEAAAREEAEAAPAPGATLEAAERRRAVSEALATLSPPQREAIELAYYEGLSQSEIAERLQQPLGTIKTRMRLGMQKLREALRPYYFEGGGVTAGEDMKELAAAYALGALAPEEAKAFEAFLAGSPETQREVAELREVGALLALNAGTGSAAPAQDLRARVLARATAQKATPLPTRARWPLWAALAASLVAVAGLGWSRAELGRELALRQTELGALRDSLSAREARLAQREEEINAILDPHVSLTLMGTAGTPQPVIQLFWNHRSNLIMAHAFQLTPAAAHRVYQLWFIPRGGKPIPSVTFNSEPTGHALVRQIAVPEGVELTAAALTEEPEGGSPQPTTPVVLLAASHQPSRDAGGRRAVSDLRASSGRAGTLWRGALSTLCGIVLLAGPPALTGQTPPDLVQERREFARWLESARLSPYAAIALQPVGRGISIGYEPADLPLPISIRGTAREERGTVTFTGTGGRSLVLARGRAVALERFQLLASGPPGRTVVAAFGEVRQYHPPEYYPYVEAANLLVTLEPPEQRAPFRSLGPDGTETQASEVGLLHIALEGQTARLRVYRLGAPDDEEAALFVFFRDQTSGHGSYPAGRFVELIPARSGQYRLDFNRSRNPFCAYNTVFPCPAPWPGNTVPVKIQAGERYLGADSASE